MTKLSDVEYDKPQYYESTDIFYKNLGAAYCSTALYEGVHIGLNMSDGTEILGEPIYKILGDIVINAANSSLEMLDIIGIKDSLELLGKTGYYATIQALIYALQNSPTDITRREFLKLSVPSALGIAHLTSGYFNLPFESITHTNQLSESTTIIAEASSMMPTEFDDVTRMLKLNKPHYLLKGTVYPTSAITRIYNTIFGYNSFIEHDLEFGEYDVAFESSEIKVGTLKLSDQSGTIRDHVTFLEFKNVDSINLIPALAVETKEEKLIPVTAHNSMFLKKLGVTTKYVEFGRDKDAITRRIDDISSSDLKNIDSILPSHGVSAGLAIRNKSIVSVLNCSWTVPISINYAHYTSAAIAKDGSLAKLTPTDYISLSSCKLEFSPHFLSQWNIYELIDDIANNLDVWKYRILNPGSLTVEAHDAYLRALWMNQHTSEFEIISAHEALSRFVSLVDLAKKGDSDAILSLSSLTLSRPVALLSSKDTTFPTNSEKDQLTAPTLSAVILSRDGNVAIPMNMQHTTRLTYAQTMQIARYYVENVASRKNQEELGDDYFVYVGDLHDGESITLAQTS